MDVILVPQWLEKQLLDSGKSLSQILDSEILMSTLSREDIAFYVWLNTNFNGWLPAVLKQVKPQGTVQSKNFDSNTGSNGVAAAADPNGFLKTLGLPDNWMDENTDVMEAISYDMLYQGKDKAFGEKDLDSADLFGPLSDHVDYNDIGWITTAIDADTIAVRPRAGEGDTIEGVQNYILMLLNQRLPFYQLARTPLFRDYVVKL